MATDSISRTISVHNVLSGHVPLDSLNKAELLWLVSELATHRAALLEAAQQVIGELVPAEGRDAMNALIAAVAEATGEETP